MSKNIILSCLLKIGDRVTMNWTDDSDDRDTRERKPNGTAGTVIGFHEYHRYYDISTAKGKKPGQYRGNSSPYVLWDDESTELVSPHDICFEDSKYIHPEVDSEYCVLFKKEAFVKDLPKLPFMVGNHVTLKSERSGSNSHLNGVMEIIDIDWDYFGRKCLDGVDFPIYRLSPRNGSGFHISVRASEIESGDPTSGNYWAWLNDKSKLKFDSSDIDGLENEIRFYESLGKVTQVRNPNTGDYGWTENEARNAVKEKTIHLWRKQRFSDFITAYKIDADLEDLCFRCFMAYGGWNPE